MTAKLRWQSRIPFIVKVNRSKTLDPHTTEWIDYRAKTPIRTPEEIEYLRAYGEPLEDNFHSAGIKVDTPDHIQIVRNQPVYKLSYTRDPIGITEEVVADLHGEEIKSWGQEHELSSGQTLDWEPTLSSRARK